MERPSLWRWVSFNVREYLSIFAVLADWFREPLFWLICLDAFWFSAWVASILYLAGMR